jgi:L,D-transpeptidase catalytic domain
LRRFIAQLFLEMRLPVPCSARLLLLATLLLAGCMTDPRFDDRTTYLGDHGNVYFTERREREREPSFDNVSYWDGDGVPGSPKIVIRLGEQRAYFYKSGTLVGVSTISSGREGLNTVTGSFHIIQKDKDHVSSRFGDYVDRNGNVIQKEIDTQKDPKPPGAIYDGAKMPYFMRIVGGTGMHEGFLPGYPASHGCIRMPGFMAEAFFRNVSVGTPVTITN